ncbi:MAG: DUF3616 domain-containing protein [Microcoleaceae cyanobacterium]
MSAGYLLDRVLLQFTKADICPDLSAVRLVDNYLWLGSDELTSIERLNYLGNHRFGEHQSYPLTDFFPDFDPEDGEVDIEGIAHDGGYLWVIGSHSTKRKKAKGSKADELAVVKSEYNRYFLCRIPIAEGIPHRTCDQRTAAYLKRTEVNDVLIEALQNDPCLAPFLQAGIPGKDNGLDIEGIAVKDGKILLGLRGPVLRGVAIILELELEEVGNHLLDLKAIEDDKRYKKHFVALDGLGIRDMCPIEGEDLLILAGPSMDLDGSLRVFRLKDAFDLKDDSYTVQDDDEELVYLFDVPFERGTDRAEGMTLFQAFGEISALLVVYDSPNPKREVQTNGTLGDVFTI